MSGNSSLRQRYAQPANEPVDDIEEIEENDAPDPQHYVAFGKTRGARREEHGFKIYHHDGKTIEVMYYRYLIRVGSTAPDKLVLFFTDSVYEITGNDLRPLMSPLRDYKITFLQAFIPQTHPPLATDNDEMVIYSILGQGNDEWWDNLEKRDAVRQKEDV